jgi:DNA-binding NtrC family response regulator
VSTILCVDDDPIALRLLVGLVSSLGHETVSATTPVEALAALAAKPIDVVIADYQLPGITGSELLVVVRDQGYMCPFIIVTAFATVEKSVAAIRNGAVNYLAKPISRAQLEASVAQALELVALRVEVDTLRAEASGARVARSIVGQSPALRDAMRTVSSVAATRATVLIQGESGTGKELFARALHDLSDRSRRPYIRLNCAALPEGLVESALFGHERGAFTGALRRTEGAFERADGGTLLLDEVSEMRVDLQAKLLRVLQEQEFERVGGGTLLKVDVRVIATTNRDLAAEVRAGTFRADLYYRLNVVHLRIPPLRERPDDIAVLAITFMKRFSAESGRNFERIDSACLNQLCTRLWPGNVRELEHAVYRAVLLSDGPVLTARAFEGAGEGLVHEEHAITAVMDAGIAPSPRVHGSSASQSSPRGGELAAVLCSFDLTDAEQTLIEGALLRTNGNRTQAARLLGINVRTLRRKLAETEEIVDHEADHDAERPPASDPAPVDHQARLPYRAA